MIARMAARNHIDVIYVNGPRVLPAAALGRAGRPLIYHSHWMVPQRSAASLARAALRRSGASAIATSRLAAEWLQDSVQPRPYFDDLQWRRRLRRFRLARAMPSGTLR